MTVAAIASLVVGIIIGFVGQRSRMCFVGGIRDWILVRDTFLLKGLVSFALVAWILFPVSELVGGDAVGAFAGPVLQTVLFTVAGGFLVGLVSIVANGCPLRQHVLAAQGTGNSMVYLAGFFSGAIIFHTAISPLLGELLL
mgnify:CR=1 FL=1